ncbi:MAG: phage virion morphogenesis protein [Candidatus Accumulibacter sp.]|jgi:phage virion morphogenesis protein|nr:phage virion morphogenesis protein [Accumulibacter sp.]
MTGFRIDVRGDAIQKITALQRRLSNPTPLMAGIAAELLSITEDAFEQESVIGEKEWKPLALSTIRQRKKRGQWPGKKLQRSSGGLAASIQPFHQTHQAGLTVSKLYAAIHQFGGMAGRGHKVEIPARPYLPIKRESGEYQLTPHAHSRLMKMVTDFVERGLWLDYWGASGF